MFQKPHVEIKMRKFGDIEQNNRKGVWEFYKMFVCAHMHAHTHTQLHNNKRMLGNKCYKFIVD